LADVCALFAQHPLTDLLTFLMTGAKSIRIKSRYACHRTTAGMAGQYYPATAAARNTTIDNAE